MKRSLAVLTVALVMFSAAQLFAINYNQSAELTRTMHRNASTEVDAAFFNPAGTVFMAGNGLFLQAANQMIFQHKVVEDTAMPHNRYGIDYEGDITAWAFPNLMGVYKQDNWAAFFWFGPIGGGGGGKYNQGIPELDAYLINAIMGYGLPFPSPGQYDRTLTFEGEVYNLALRIGGAFQINNMFSVALGYQFTYAYKHYKGELRNLMYNSTNFGVGSFIANLNTKADIKGTGYGHSIIAGFDMRVNNEVNIGFKYEYNWRLITKNDTTYTGVGADIFGPVLDTTTFGDGYKQRITEPMFFGIGVSWQITPELRVEPGFTAQLFHYGNYDGQSEDNRANQYYMGAAVEYIFIPGLKTSVGYAYETSNRKPSGQDELDFSLNAHYFCGGFTYAVTPDLSITLGVVYTYYPDEHSTTVSSFEPKGRQTYHQDYTWDIGLGVSYRMPM